MKTILRAMVLGAFIATVLALIGFVQGPESPLFYFTVRVAVFVLQAGLILMALTMVLIVIGPFLAAWEWIDRHFK